MKTSHLLIAVVLLSLTASPTSLQAEAEEQKKRKNWFQRLIQRTRPSSPTGGDSKAKETPAKPRRDPVKAESREARKPTEVDKKEKDPKKWSEDERRKLEDYLNRKRKDRDQEAEEEARPGRGGKNKQNKGGGRGRGKGPAWKQRGGLPPGLQKKLERGGELPPGWQKKLAAGEVMDQEVYAQAEPLPREIFMTLPPQPHDTEIVTIEDKVVRVIKDTRRILDVFGLGDKLTLPQDAPTKPN